MADTPRGPTHVKRVLDFISPKIGDFIFYERVKAELVNKPTGLMPADYGGAHGLASVYPDHKMVAVKPDPEEGWVRVYYAKERANQEAYNYEVDAPLDDDWPRLVQTWVILRSAYTGPGMSVTAPPALGKTWTRTGDVERRTGDEITDSLFVVLRVFYRDISTVLVDWEQDPETRDTVKIERQIVSGMAVPTFATGTEVTQKALGTGFSLRVTRTINSGSAPTAYNLAIWVPFRRPTLMYGLSGVSGDDGETWLINYSEEAGYEKRLQGRRYVDFSSTTPVNSASLLQLKPVNWKYNGVHFDVHATGIIADFLDNFGSTGGSYTETVDLPASDPTLTEYLALVGTEQLWTEEAARWRYGYYRREREYVILE